MLDIQRQISRTRDLHKKRAVLLLLKKWLFPFQVRIAEIHQPWEEIELARSDRRLSEALSPVLSLCSSMTLEVSPWKLQFWFMIGFNNVGAVSTTNSSRGGCFNNVRVHFLNFLLLELYFSLSEVMTFGISFETSIISRKRSTENPSLISKAFDKSFLPQNFFYWGGSYFGKSKVRCFQNR